MKGPAGVKHLADVLHPGIPDMALPIEDAVAEGEKVLVRLRLVGTHRRDLMGLPATGKPIDIGGTCSTSAMACWSSTGRCSTTSDC